MTKPCADDAIFQEEEYIQPKRNFLLVKIQLWLAKASAHWKQLRGTTYKQYASQG